MIQSMFGRKGYNQESIDDESVDNMEVGYDEIEKEERRAAKIAAKEDA